MTETALGRGEVQSVGFCLGRNATLNLVEFPQGRSSLPAVDPKFPECSIGGLADAEFPQFPRSLMYAGSQVRTEIVFG